MTDTRSQSLVLIGGGVMRNGETKEIDLWVLERVKKKRGVKVPRVLFIPTASKDFPAYINDFTRRYTSYGAAVESLRLFRDVSPQMKVWNDVLASDLLYFGGGSTSLLLNAIKKYRLGPVLSRFARGGGIIAGLSAGAIIWGGKFVNFDRRGNSFISYRVDRGLGWIDKVIVPHFSPQILDKRGAVDLLKKNVKGTVLAVGDGAAAYWDNSDATPNFFKVDCRKYGFCGELEELMRRYGK